MPIIVPPFTTSASITGSTQIATVDEQLNVFMNDVESYMTTSFNSASTQISNEVAGTIVNSSVTASRSTATFTTTANTWYRIASSPINIERNSGIFVVDCNTSGFRSAIRFSANCIYGVTGNTSIEQISYVSGITQARIVYHTTYTGNYAYLEILIPSVVPSLLISVELQDAIGWTLVTPSTVGSIPSGYTTYVHTFVNIALTTAGSFPKITFNKEGRVTSGTSLVAADIPSIDTSKLTTGTLPVARGGTGTTTSTGTGSTVLSTSPTLVTPNIGVATGTSFNGITGLSSTLPVMAGTATIGTATTAARADHKHPVDTSRAALVHNHTTLTGLTNLAYDVTNVASPLVGETKWNSTEGTLDIGLGSAILQVGQEQLVRVRNNTASTIVNGSAVMASGTIGASGRITIAPANLTQVNAKQILGIVTESIAPGADGFCTVFGKVRGLQTTGAMYGETWVDGDIIYVKPSGNWALTKVAPTGSTVRLPIAIVINAHATNGTLFVRVNSIDENHAEPALATKASVNQVMALGVALGLTTEQVNTILNSNP